MSTIDFPIVISGAGPAGATTALYLAKENIPHLVLEKGIFPRDKICGDAVSGKGLEILAKADMEAVKNFAAKQDKNLLTYGIQFSAPNGKSVDIAFPKPKGELPIGFVSKRIDFDHFLYNTISKNASTEIWQNAELTDVIYENGGVLLNINHDGVEKQVRTKIIIGADGQRSIVKRKLNGFEQDDKHFCGGIRAYYTGVKDIHPENYLELHFLKELLPGYFWIFPLPDGGANVGMGMLSSDIKKNKVNMRKAMLEMIEKHPVFSKRFSEAKLEGQVVGWGLPLGSKKRSISGNNYILTGDAASLIDPFTGEGIGNAIVSGLVASRIAKKALDANDFSAAALMEYDKIIYQKLWNELKLSHRMQQLTTYPWLFNFVVNRIHGSKALQDVFTNMFTDLDLRSQMKNPLFYFKLFFK